MNIKNTDIINVKGQIKQTNKKQKLIKILDSNNTILGSQTTDDSGNFNIEITPSGVFDISKVEICNKITELNEDSIEFNTITPLNSILTVPTPPTNVVYSDNFNITANLKNEYNEAIEGGLIKLLVGQTIVAEKETDENGNVTFTRKPVSTGNHSFTIEYEGDDYHNKATPQTINIVVGKETSILNIENPLPNSSWYSDKGILVEGILIDNDDPNTPLNRKNISISCDEEHKTLTTDDNGRFSGYIKPTNTGICSVVVEFEDENYSGNTTTIENIVVNDPYIDLSVTNPILSYADGDKATISATLHSGDPAGKTVSFTMGGNALGTGVTDGNGVAICNSQYSSQGIGDIICEAEATVNGQVLTETYEIQDIVYYNNGSVDKSSDFSTSFITHDSTNQYYIFNPTSSGYNITAMSKLTGLVLNNHTIEFDCYITSSGIDYGFGFGIGGSQWAFIGLNDYRRCTSRSATASNDSYHNGSFTALTRNWIHFKYTIQNNTLKMEIFKDNTVVVTLSVGLGSLFSSDTISYRLMPFWASGQRYIKNIKVKPIQSISVDVDNPILSFADSTQANPQIATLTATVSPIVQGRTVKIYKGDVLVATEQTNSQGQVSYEYTSQGIGDVEFKFECGALSETTTIEDCWFTDDCTGTSPSLKWYCRDGRGGYNDYYSSDSTVGKYLFIRTDNDTISPRFDWNDDFEFTCKIKQTTQWGGFGIRAYYTDSTNSIINYYTNYVESGYLCIAGKPNSNWNTLKIRVENGTTTMWVNGVQKCSGTIPKTVSYYTLRGASSSNPQQISDVKIKKL